MRLQTEGQCPPPACGWPRWFSSPCISCSDLSPWWNHPCPHSHHTLTGFAAPYPGQWAGGRLGSLSHGTSCNVSQSLTYLQSYTKKDWDRLRVCLHVNLTEMFVSCYTCLDSFPGLPHFRSSVCGQYNTRRRKSAKNGEGLVSFITWVMSGGRKNDIRGKGPTANIIYTHSRTQERWIRA